MVSKEYLKELQSKLKKLKNTEILNRELINEECEKEKQMLIEQHEIEKEKK